MSQLRIGICLLIAGAFALPADTADAVNITIDYTYAGSFFPVGSQARTSMDAAATFYSNILNDTLSAIQPPSFTGSGGTVQWHWGGGIIQPSSGATIQLNDGTIAADEYVIYVGARAHPEGTLALGTHNVLTDPCCWRSGPSNSSFTSAEVTTISAIQAAFVDAVTTRGETSGFANWGGSISFDNDDTEWHFNHLTQPPAGKIDLYSVAIHEIAHSLGFGASTEWTALRNGSTFVGDSAKAVRHGPVPLATGDNAHWLEGLGSVIYSGTGTQTAAMTPGLAPGTRKRLTAIDAAALTDLGWEVGPLGDYNRDGIVNAADFTLWRDTRGQSVVMGMAADGSGNGSVGDEDYNIWKSRFGQAAGAGAASLAVTDGAVPEPDAFALVVAVWTMTSTIRFARR